MAVEVAVGTFRPTKGLVDVNGRRVDLTASGSTSKRAPPQRAPASQRSAPSPAPREKVDQAPAPSLLRARGRVGVGSGWGRGSAAIKAALDELGEGAGAMADPMLFGRVDFPEGQSSAQRYEDRVVAEAAVAAGRPGEPAFDLAAEHLGVAVRPGQRKHRDKSGAAVLAAEFPMNPLHRLPE